MNHEADLAASDYVVPPSAVARRAGEHLKSCRTQSVDDGSASRSHPAHEHDVPLGREVLDAGEVARVSDREGAYPVVATRFPLFPTARGVIPYGSVRVTRDLSHLGHVGVRWLFQIQDDTSRRQTLEICG